jgi:hypothetical protein
MAMRWYSAMLALITERHGGRGAVREACEFILDAQGKLAADAGTVSDGDDRPMKKWSSALLPLSILLVLVVLTAWLRYVTEFPEVRNDGKSRHDPDYIISGVLGRKLDASGNLLYTLTADEIRHYPDDDTTDLLKPTLIYLDPKQPPVIIRSGMGRRTRKPSGSSFGNRSRYTVPRPPKTGNWWPRCPS